MDYESRLLGVVRINLKYLLVKFYGSDHNKI